MSCIELLTSLLGRAFFCLNSGKRKKLLSPEECCDIRKKKDVNWAETGESDEEDERTRDGELCQGVVPDDCDLDSGLSNDPDSSLIANDTNG
ncbi:unnamed protein product [Enterobius vermicularis]|uniref:Uncharacterized protein n=1 Tax=Enterobius vermicularis TaxID=51028 RepID=A0A0N4VFG5_ENTVE|nr:unnamed protein product [Enterobius vermicularis]